MKNRFLYNLNILDDFFVNVDENFVNIAEVFVNLNEAVDNVVGFFVNLAEKRGKVDEEVDKPVYNLVKPVDLMDKLAKLTIMYDDEMGKLGREMCMCEI